MFGAKSKSSSPSWQASIIPVIVLILLMFAVVRVFGSDALSGASQIALILSTGVAVFLAIVVFKCRWSVLEEAILDNLRNVGNGILILFMIGMISGTWMVSGIVPTLICYGLKIISPVVFLLAVCAICACVSMVTGSSWTTIATIGVAMIGIGAALGYSAPLTAGAIISGAYFGDKISPLSDTTVMASSSAGVPLFTHIRYMLITTVPSFVITLVIFLVLSLNHSSEMTIGADATSEVLSNTFNISPFLLVVPVFTLVLIIKKVPAIITLLLSSIAAVIAAAIAQPHLLVSIADGTSADFSTLFKGMMISCFGATQIQTGVESINSLISTRGMNGMMPTVSLVICASCFGGALVGSGMIKSITDALTRRIKSRAATVSSTVVTGLFSNVTMGDQYLSIILTCNLFKKLYSDNGYEDRLLSRSVEDSATVTSVLVPWNSCGMTQSTVLHIATLEYLPFCFFNLISPLMSMLVAVTGYKIIHKVQRSS